MKPWNLISPKNLAFEKVIQFASGNDYHLALEALFEVEISTDLRTLWFKIFRELSLHTLPHVTAFLVGRALGSEAVFQDTPTLSYYFYVMSIMNPRGARGVRKPFSKEDYKIIADLMVHNVSKFRELESGEAYELAWILKSSDLINENSPLDSESPNQKKVSQFLSAVKFE